MKKQNTKDTTILYCGAFKPMTGAHLDLIKRYLNDERVKKIIIFVSPGKRDNFNVEDSKAVIDVLLSNIQNVEVIVDESSYSPILAIYRWIEQPNKEPGKYALASSNKSSDYQRVKEFTRNYSPDRYGKNLSEGVEVVEFLIDAKPLLYKNTSIPISASEARKNIVEGDYEKFKLNYPNIPETKIKYIWDTLKSHRWVEQLDT